ncbi:MAG: LamG-like jellyroll fold domain-containing protein, partial [Ferruginibacter sp.]
MHIITQYAGKKLFVIGFLLFSLCTKTIAQSALQFDGTNDYTSFGAASPSLNVSAFTLEAWIRIQGAGITTTTSGAGGGGLEGANAVVPLVTKGRGEAEAPANVNINYFMGLVGNRLAADFEEPTGPNHAIIGSTVIPLNTWTHVAATYDPVTAVWNLYINGNPEATLDIGTNISPANTSIQHAALATGLTSAGTAAGFFNGRMDEVRIWNVVRTAAEISSNFTTEISSGTGLIGRWGLNEGTGTAAGNSIGGSPSGVLTNGPSWISSAPALDVPPAAPSSAAAVSSVYYAVNISWADNSANETGFQIERSLTGINGTYVLLTTTAANATSFTDNLVAPNIEFCYRIRAINGAGSSGYTSAVCATPPAEPANALDLGASGAYVSFGAAPSLATSTFTIETWFKKTGPG